MGKVNVYLPDDLEAEVKDAGVAVSPACQAALRAMLDRIHALRHDDPSVLSHHLGVGRLSSELAEVMDELVDKARAAGDAPGAFELLGAIVLHADNRGARVLRDLGVELPARAVRARRRTRQATVTLAADGRDVLVDAFRIALDMRHDVIGTEHVVIALAAQPSLQDLFGALGLDSRSIRSRVERRVDTEPLLPAATNELTMARFERELRRLGEEFRRLREGR